MNATYCETCKVVHFHPDVYKRWLSKYAGSRGGVAEQMARWQAIVDKHTKKLRLHAD